MKIVYAALLIVYVLGLSWYGGSGDPVEDAELETYIKFDGKKLRCTR